MIIEITRNQYPLLIDIWKESVKATHHFLSEEDFNFFFSQMTNFFDAVKLYGVKDKSDRIMGFLGVSEDEIEMLFIHPNYFRKGIGNRLAKFAICDLGKTKVAVNEQNVGAFEFYQTLGFNLVSRSDKDGFGKPYPILNLSL